MMRTIGGDAGEDACSTESQMLAAIHTAMPGAQVTGCQMAARLQSARVKLARGQQTQIGRLEREHARMIADLEQTMVRVTVADAKWV